MAELLVKEAVEDMGQGGHTPLFRALRQLCVASAALGGLTIFLAACAVTASVVMRNIGVGGIRGDFELVELTCAICASLFLPLCQFTRGHVMVDLFTGWMPLPARRALDGVWMLLFGLVWAFLAWRLSHGMLELKDYGDRTMLLRAPIWWVYVPAVFGTGLSAVVAVLTSLPMLAGKREFH
ncbi:Tripartite ATP-independent periplasmic transporters, DctQ component [Aquimixticola soesokkakensis]|uniref:TRAP transporter small permease protein n=1 Tax=Aquimixticola soesokkakensis TaxID=1519096 RepID=A0A1Y5RVG1_9RHOB|nr:TRAP transporter small permease [Aquimixticola soesokkakensis]SLN25979.1 Tripartite ATP-independent periplasmic transporters, DctQ component [Aquimixticola soesokkakensis]